MSEPATEMPRKAAEVFTREEIAVLTERSDLRGAWAVISTYGVIAAALSVLALWPTPLTFGFALIVVGGRQLALAILAHEASHGTLFRSKALNRQVGDWLCGRPIWIDLDKYRVHHMVHHTKTGTDADSDRSLVAPFPTTRVSLLRKLLRDTSGLTGLKFLLGRLLMDAELIAWTVAHDVRRLPRHPWHVHLRAAAYNMTPTLLMNGLLFLLLLGSGHAWLYGVWALAYLTTFTLFIRIRSLAEHACTAASTDPFLNTRTTRAGWLARLTVAPVHVNFHLEHHFLMSVPYFRLPEMHRMLRERGVVDDGPSYLDVLELVSSARGDA